MYHAETRAQVRAWLEHNHDTAPVSGCVRGAPRPGGPDARIHKSLKRRTRPVATSNDDRAAGPGRWGRALSVEFEFVCQKLPDSSGWAAEQFCEGWVGGEEFAVSAGGVQAEH
jgi:hypothetical protein